MADTEVVLRWEGDGQRYRGGAVGGPELVLDSAGVAGPSPVTALALSLAGCMAIDVLDIAQKMRLTVTALEVGIEGDRRAEPPRRLTAVRLTYRLKGVAAEDEDKVQRAIDLSREKYCSVLHSLREDIRIDIDLDLG